MQLSKGLVRTVALAAFVLALAAPPARAQFGGSTGGIAGRVADEQGGALPGVSVTIKGPGAPQTVYTNARGEFHVINLAPGEYSVSLALQGFAAVERENVAVTLGRDTELALSMKLSAVAATVTVSGEVPVISTRKVESSTASRRTSSRRSRRRAIPGSSSRRSRACRSTASTWAATRAASSRLRGQGRRLEPEHVARGRRHDHRHVGAAAPRRPYYDFDRSRRSRRHGRQRRHGRGPGVHV